MDAPAFLRLIGEPTRHGILAHLRRQEDSVGGLVDALDGEQSNISHHLRTLRDAGLVASRPVGRNRFYRLADPELRRLLDQVDELADRLERVAYFSGLQLPYSPEFHGYG